MRTLNFIFRALPFLGLALLLHYLLPQHDTVQITSTQIVRTNVDGLNSIFYDQPDSGQNAETNRDIRFVDTIKVRTLLLGFIPRDATEVMVYRNEDTGLIWPPYFKFDSSDLQAEASAAARGEGWHVITHYGWRIPIASIYPNAVSIRPVDGPRPGVVPWFNMVFFILLLAALLALRTLWRRFRERVFGPAIDAAENRVDHARADIARRRSGLRDWFNKDKS